VDHFSNTFVVLGEVLRIFCLQDSGRGGSTSKRVQVRVLLKTVSHPKVPLLVPIHDESGAVICTTLGEAQGVCKLRCTKKRVTKHYFPMFLSS
jgi:hypothetical protein